VLYGTPVITGAGELGVVFSNLTQGQYYDLIKDVRDLLGGTISYRGLY